MADNKNKNAAPKASLKDRIVGFFTGVATETKRVRWPKFSKLMVDTGKVLLFCVLFAVFFIVADLLISELLVLIGVGK